VLGIYTPTPLCILSLSRVFKPLGHVCDFFLAVISQGYLC